VIYGQSVKFTATVPTDTVGTVTFSDGAHSLGAVHPVNGVASLVAKLNAGTHTVFAKLSGDPIYATAGSLPVSVKVAKSRPKSIGFTTSSVHAKTKQKVSVKLGALTGGGWPTGTIALKVDGKSTKTVHLSSSQHGQASFALHAKRTKSFTVKATFTPSDPANVSSVSSTTHRVTVRR
jgi:hypothetical protein